MPNLDGPLVDVFAAHMPPTRIEIEIVEGEQPHINNISENIKEWEDLP